MNIQVIVQNEAAFIEAIRKELIMQARLAVMDDNNRKGKQFAAVTFDIPNVVTLLYLKHSKIEYV